MSNQEIYITIVRTGKNPTTVGIPSGGTLKDALDAAGIASSDYNSWTFTDEEGETLSLTTRLHNSVSVIVGQRVQGAQ